MDGLAGELGGDAKRISLAGQSMGGNGAWSLAALYPGKFCSLAPVCGYIEGGREGAGVPSGFDLGRIKHVPTWVFHAADDSVVGVGCSDAAVEGLEDLGAPEVKYTRYAEGLAPPCKTKAGDLPGHASYELAFREEAFWPWLESKTL
jgi:predicted peptidase